MAFSADLLENAILVLPWGGAVALPPPPPPPKTSPVGVSYVNAFFCSNK